MDRCLILGLLVLAGVGLACDNYDNITTANISTQRLAVIDGQSDPSQLQFDLTPEQQNAVIANRYLHGEWYQGCTSNVINDRIAVSAAHCVLANIEAWRNGAEPVALAPEELSFKVGPDVDQALCTLSTKQIYVHPEARMDSSGWMYNDVSVIVLADSVAATCPQITPIAVSDVAVTVFADDEEMLQGGYGSLDGSYAFSPIRYWSKLSYLGPQSGTPDSYLWFQNAGSGVPSMGDSGSGIFFENHTGDLQMVGVCSMTATMGEIEYYGFTRIDTALNLIEATSAAIEACEQVANGACEDQILVSCGEAGIERYDCRDDGKTCHSDAGSAQCVAAEADPDPDPGYGCQSLQHANIFPLFLLMLFALRLRPRRAG